LPQKNIIISQACVIYVKSIRKVMFLMETGCFLCGGNYIFKYYLDELIRSCSTSLLVPLLIVLPSLHLNALPFLQPTFARRTSGHCLGSYVAENVSVFLRVKCAVSLLLLSSLIISSLFHSLSFFYSFAFRLLNLIFDKEINLHNSLCDYFVLMETDPGTLVSDAGRAPEPVFTQ
jgi:hypothetical protein